MDERVRCAVAEEFGSKPCLIRSWSALRIMSPDGFPVYEESSQFPGAFVVTCHSGVTLAAAHALKLAPKLLGNDFNDTFAAFSPMRFNVQEI